MTTTPSSFRPRPRGWLWWIVSASALALSASLATGAPKGALKPTSDQQPWAVLYTSQGTLVLQLFEKRVPKTVAHFIGLATGDKAWRDPKTKKMVKKPFYNGLSVHKIVPTYWIQMGCPLGNGKGGPGYMIKDEFHPQLKHQGPGVVSMANAGPNRNGSQFVITLRTAPWLDAKKRTGRFCSNFANPVRCLTNNHCARYAKMFPKQSKGKATCEKKTITQGYTVFGKVVHGLRDLTKIGDQAVDVNGRPIQKTTIQQISIFRGRTWQRRWLKRSQGTP